VNNPAAPAILVSTYTIYIQRSNQTITAIAAGSPDFSTLVAALARAGLVETFNGQQVFTVFAPNNAAYDEAAKQLYYRNGREVVEKLDIRTLTAVLTCHVIAGQKKAAEVVTADQFHMLSGVEADVAVRGGTRTSVRIGDMDGKGGGEPWSAVHRAAAGPAQKHPCAPSCQRRVIILRRDEGRSSTDLSGGESADWWTAPAHSAKGIGCRLQEWDLAPFTSAGRGHGT
jgi:hypothetical protein